MSDRADFDDFFRAGFPLLVGFLRKHPKAWVRKAGLRVANEHLRRQRREDWKPDQDPAATEDGLAGYEERAVIVQVLVQLPPRQRTVMAWHIDGYSTEEIAALPAMPVSTVRSNLRHARKHLDDVYAQLRQTEGDRDD